MKTQNLNKSPRLHIERLSLSSLTTIQGREMNGMIFFETQLVRLGLKSFKFHCPLAALTIKSQLLGMECHTYDSEVLLHWCVLQSGGFGGDYREAAGASVSRKSALLLIKYSYSSRGIKVKAGPTSSCLSYKLREPIEKGKRSCKIFP